MPSTVLQLTETDVVKLVLNFLHTRSLNISMLALEREAGVINGIFSDDMLFLRQLILDGQWDDVLAFIAPLADISAFNIKQFQYVINKHKYLELLCIKTETGMQDYEGTIDELVDVLKRLEELCPTKEEYNNLWLLWTLGKLSDSSDYKNWNPSNARVECFKDVFGLIEKFLPLDKREKRGDRLEKADDDRLLQLLIKGLLYESCVEHCQQKATSQCDASEMKLSGLLAGGAFCDADLSLLSWLQALPHETFACPFEQKNLKINIKPIMKPSLEASWSEQIMVTPIKPKVFPHSAIPASRRSIDVMSRSLNPQYDGLAYGLGSGRKEVATRNSTEFTAGMMSKSFGGFHLNAGSNPRASAQRNLMHTSIDKLFEVTPMMDVQSSVILEEISGAPSPIPPKICHSPDDGTVTPPKHMASALATSTPMVKAKNAGKSHQSNNNGEGSWNPRQDSTGDSSDLYREYQKQRQRIEDQMAEHAKRDVLRQHLQQTSFIIDDNRLNESNKEGHPGVRDKALPEESSGREKLNETDPNKPTQFMFIATSEEESVPRSPKPTLTSTLERKKKQTVMKDNPETKGSPGRGVKNTSHSPGGGRGQTAKVQRTGSGRARNTNQNAKGISGSRSPMMPRGRGGDSTKSDMKENEAGLVPASGDVYYTSEVTPSPQRESPGLNEASPPANGESPGNKLSEEVKVSGMPLTTRKPTPQGIDVMPDSLRSEGTSQSLITSQKIGDDSNKPGFVAVTTLEDPQAVRAVAFHPTGHLYAVGANSKTLRICTFPNLAFLKEDHDTLPATVTFKRQKHHKGSIYCVAWSPLGDLIATGSNDKAIKLLRYDADNHTASGSDMELNFHDGTVRDVVFMQDQSSQSSLLISGGAGDCKVYVTDCQTGTAIRSMAGHSGHIYSLHTWGGCMFVSGAQDRTARVWDLRAPAAINVVPSPAPGSAFASVCVDPSGRLLASGHEDSSVMLWDVRGNRIVQSYKAHTSDVRSVRFSMNAYYLLSASYDNKVVLTDLHGDLMRPLPSVVVAEHKDKVIQCRWHPSQLAFLTTSADRSVKSWALPVV